MNRRRPWSAPVSRKKVRKIPLPSRTRMAKSWEEIRAALAWARIPIPHLDRRAVIFTGVGLVVVMTLFVCRGKITALLNHPRLQVRSIAVEGNRYADSGEILKLSGLRQGQSWVLLDAGAVRRRARVHPWVDDVVVERPWLGKVRLKVRESVPVAHLDFGGASRGLAADLKILPSSPADSSDLPQIRGIFTGSRRGIDLPSLERALSYVRAIRRERGVASLPIVLTMNPSGRDEILLESMGVDVILEEPLSPEIAVRNVAAFLETLDSPGECRGTLHVFSKTAAVWAAKV
jgi:hypothetical protein